METIFDYVLEQLYLEEKYALRKLTKKLTGKRRLKSATDWQVSGLKHDKASYKGYVTQGKKDFSKGDERKDYYKWLKKDRTTWGGPNLRRRSRHVERIKKFAKNKGS